MGANPASALPASPFPTGTWKAGGCFLALVTSFIKRSDNSQLSLCSPARASTSGHPQWPPLLALGPSRHPPAIFPHPSPSSSCDSPSLSGVQPQQPLGLDLCGPASSQMSSRCSGHSSVGDRWGTACLLGSSCFSPDRCAPRAPYLVLASVQSTFKW